MNDVFISYSRRDKEFIQKLYEALTAANKAVWADWDSIPAASDWFAEIKQGIEETDSVIFVLSPEWIKSKECRKEMNYALEMGKRLFPILYIPVDPKDVPTELSKINWVNMRDTDDFDKAIQTLCDAMDTDLGWIKLHTRIQVRALEWEKKNRSASFALRGEDLTEGEQFIASGANKNPVPTQLQSEYILESRKDASKRQRITLIGITAALVVSIVLGIYAFVQAKISRAGELAALALSEKDEHYSLAMLLDVEGYRTLENSRTEGALSILIDLYPELESYLSGHTDSVSGMDFSADGKFLASGSWDNTIILWDAKTHQQIGPPLKGHTDKVTTVAFSPNGKLLASGSWDNTIIFWDVETHQEIGEQLKGHTDKVISIAFSPDGKYLASGSNDGTFILWDVTNPSTPTQLTKQSNNGNAARSVAISPDGKLLASGSGVNIILWDISDPKHSSQLEQLEPYNQREALGITSSLAFSPNGQYLAAGSLYYVTSIWDMKSYQQIGVMWQGHGSSVLSIAFSPSGDKLASGSDDNNIIVWDVSNPGKPTDWKELSGSGSAVTSMAFSPDGVYLAAGSLDSTIALWNMDNPSVPSRLVTLGGLYSPLSSTIFDPNNNYIAAGSYNNTVILWDAETYKLIKRLQGHNKPIRSLNFSPDGKLLVSGSEDQTFIIWNVQTQEPIIQKTTQAAILSITFSSNGQYLAIGSLDGTIALWDVSNPAIPQQIISRKDHTDEVHSVAFSPDGNTLASGSEDELITVWDVRDPHSPSKLATLPNHKEGVNSVAFSPDGRFLASGSNDNSIIIWDVTTYKQLITLKGHHKPVTNVTFSPDGTRLVSGGRDNTAIVWDISNLSFPYQLATFSDTEWINSVAFSPDGKRLVGGGDSATVIVWDIDPDSWIEKLCQRVGRNFTHVEWAQYFPKEKYRKTCDQWDLEPKPIQQ